VDMLHRAVIADIQMDGSLGTGAANRLRYYLARQEGTESRAEIMSGAMLYLKGIAEDSRSRDEGVRAFVDRYIGHPLVAPMRRAIAAVRAAAEAGVNQERLFAESAPDRRPLQRAELAVRALLTAVIKSRPGHFTRNIAGITLCYLAVLRLISSRKVRSLVASVIPRRSEDGHPVRDRRAQIRGLIEKNEIYHRRYFALVKLLYPVLVQQVQRLIDSFHWESLLFRTPAGDANSNAYLKLLTNVLHDSLHAGLGVYVGFRYSAAGRAMEDGARSLLRDLAQSD